MRLVRPFETMFLICAVLAGAAVSLWLAIWSPDALLRDPLPLYRQGAATSSPDIVGNREIRHIRLVGPDDEALPFHISLPMKMPIDTIPVVVIVGGFSSDIDPLRYVTHPGPNAIVTYRPSFEEITPIESPFPFGGWEARSHTYRMPEEVSAILAWVGRQEWADKKRINLAGVGWGAVMLPAIRRRAAATGQQVNASVFINGGVDLKALADANLKIDQAWPRYAAAWLASFVLRPLAPETHLPEIAGPFLLINAGEDGTIPDQARAGLEAQIPAPKTAVTIEPAGDTPDAFAARVVRIAQNWLIAQNAVNP